MIENIKDLQKTMSEIYEWQVDTFPTSTPTSKLHHLAKEVKELIDELDKNEIQVKDVEMEYADCFLLLLGSAAMCGFTADDIFRIINEKMEINKKRKWGKPDENGVVLHIKE